MKRKTVSTSKDLLNVYPFLEGQKGWTKFANEFDKPEYREKRAKDGRAIRAPKQPNSIRELLNHCTTILRGEMLIGFSNLDDPTERVWTAEDEMKERLKSASVLAEKVECLLSDTREGDRLRAAVEKDITRLRTIAPARNSMDAWKALFVFIEREGTLPTKPQLNWEVNHIAHGRMDWFVTNSTMKEGDPVVANGKKYRAYGCYDDYRTDDQYRQFFGVGCKLVPEHEWQQPYWIPTENRAHIFTSCGLKGLPDGPKGKLVGRRR